MIRLGRREAIVALGSLAGCALRPLRVLLAAPADLEAFLFWVALGSGAFADEGLSVAPELVPPRDLVPSFLADPEAVALLPAPLLLELVAARASVRAFASLLGRDLHHLVARAAEPVAASLPERLAPLEGSRIGVAPAAEGRLRALLAAAGANAHIARIDSRRLNTALAARRVDALFVASPQLERAIARQGASVIASSSDVPALGDLQLLSAVAHTTELESDGPRAFVRALTGVLSAARDAPSDAASAILTVLSDRAPSEIEPLASLYAAALPASVVVSAERLHRAAMLVPGRAPIPDAPQALEPFLDADLAATGAEWPPLLAALALALAGGAAAFVARRRARRK